MPTNAPSTTNAARSGRKRKEPGADMVTEEGGGNSLPDIIPDGNVILIVGPNKTKIRISSHLLSSTSAVFRAMLGPNFREGALLRESQGPVEILLPDDNPQAFWNVYSALYGAHPCVHFPKPDEIYEIATLAHKYDLVERLTLAREAWFGDTDDRSYGSAEADWKMLVAAYWLESDFGFANMSLAFIEAKERPLYRHGIEMRDQVLGLKLCCKQSSWPL